MTPIQDEAARSFYARLFERSLDQVSVRFYRYGRAGKKLKQMIDVTVASLERLEVLRFALKDLGRRHDGYGV